MRIGTSHFYWAAGAMALLSALLLLPGLGGGFLFDDRANIVGNSALHLADLSLRSLAQAAYSFQPGNGSRALSMLSLALDYWRAGPDPHAFKVTNVAIHCVTVFILAIFLRRLLHLAGWSAKQAALGGVSVALVWGIHPLQVSSVLYVVQRMQTLATLFVVLSLWAYLRMREAQLQGARSRQFGVLFVLFAVLAFASKEDSVLVAVYAFILEVFFLHFRARSRLLASVLKGSYGLSVVVGLLLYFLVVLPHQWQWQAYPGRDFSSYERLLTQGRVLVMYMGQVLAPLPGNLPFFYDDLVISRGLLQPVTTLLSFLLLASLLVLAWLMRVQRPVFTGGIFLFFAGHFIASNVYGLELAFEHRNHFPLIGALLAVADLVHFTLIRYAVAPRRAVIILAFSLVGVGAATLSRAHTWGDPLRFAEYSVSIRPGSERAWLALGSVYIERGGLLASNPWLGAAINVNSVGAGRTGSALLLSNVAIYKTVRGDVSPGDWGALLERLKVVPMSPQNKGIMWVLMDDIRYGVALDEGAVLKALETISSRADLSANDYLRIGAFIHNDSLSPGEALPYLRRAVEMSPDDDPEILRLFTQLSTAGREDWVGQLKMISAGHSASEQLK